MPIRSARVPFVRSVARLAPASAAPLTTAAAVFAASLSTTAHAQCGPRWVHGQAQQFPGVLGFKVVDVDVGDLRVSNTFPNYKECVVVGGTFIGAGNVAANGVAYWDGENWFNAGGALAPGTEVSAVGIDDGRIIFAGQDPGSYDTWVKRFDPWSGQTVEELRFSGNSDPAVTAIEHVNGRFLMISTVDIVGSVYTGGVLHRRSGGIYAALGGGIDVPFGDVFPCAFQGETYLFGSGGGFSSKTGSLGSAVVYDTAWNEIRPRAFIDAEGATTWNDEVIVSGDVNLVPTGGSFRSVAAFNGESWRQLPELPAGDFRLFTHQGALVAYGRGEPRTLTQNAWNVLPRQPLTRSLASGSQFDAATFNTDAIFVGNFEVRERHVPIARHVIRHDGSEYLPLSRGLDLIIRDTLLVDEILYAVGTFVMAGGQRANYVASWDGVRWSPMGAGLASQTGGIAEWGGKPVVSGVFQLGGGQTAHRVCSWDGTQWTPIAPDLASTFSELTVIDGVLYVLGENLLGDADVLRLVNGQWEPLPDLGPGRSAICMTNFDNALHVGATGGEILRLDGQSWTQQGQRLGTGYVADLLSYNGVLLCGYARSYNEPDGAVFRLAGDTWIPFGSQQQIRFVFDLHIHEGKLYAAGGPPETEAGGLWVFDEDWQSIPGLTSEDSSRYAYSLNSAGPELIVSGYFDRVDGRPTGYWTRWNPTGTPRFLEQPQSVITMGELHRLTVRLAPPYDAEATYRWYIDGEPVLGSTSNRPWLDTQDQGTYFCRITIGCLTVDSEIATIAAAPFECPGDADRSGQVNFSDIPAVLANFGQAGGGTSILGDANGDSQVNFLDITTVLANFGTSCP